MGNVKTYKVCECMLVIVTRNMRKLEMFNMVEFEVSKIEEDRFDINGEWFEYNVFRESFIPAFFLTVYRYQGADVDEHYNIYDVNRMDKNQLYTCLSCTTKYEYIHLDSAKFLRCYKVRSHLYWN